MLGMREYTHSIKQVGKKCQKKVCARREVPPPCQLIVQSTIIKNDERASGQCGPGLL